MKSSRLLLVALALFSGSALAAEPKNPPAKVTNPVKESELNSITLTPEAEKRLGLETAVVERRKVERTRVFGGELILPAPANAGPNIFAVLPGLSPTELIRVAEAQIDANAQVDRASVTVDAAKVTLTRAEKLVADKAGAVRSVDDARAQVALAEAGVRAAKARRDLLGAPVLDFANLKSFWVRVPVYVGDLARLNISIDAKVGELAARSGAKTFPARPVAAPPSANAAASTVDLFYELANEGGVFRFGQKVGVAIPLNEPEEALVVPWSAIVHDVNGGTWLYENPAPQTFVRRRVQLRRVVGRDAVLDSGPKVGTRVVTVAVAELFGTEFGPGK